MRSGSARSAAKRARIWGSSTVVFRTDQSSRTPARCPSLAPARPAAPADCRASALRRRGRESRSAPRRWGRSRAPSRGCNRSTKPRVHVPEERELQDPRGIDDPLECLPLLEQGVGAQHHIARPPGPPPAIRMPGRVRAAGEDQRQEATGEAPVHTHLPGPTMMNTVGCDSINGARRLHRRQPGMSIVAARAGVTRGASVVRQKIGQGMISNRSLGDRGGSTPPHPPPQTAATSPRGER